MFSSRIPLSIKAMAYKNQMMKQSNTIFTLLLYVGLIVGLVIWSPWGENFEHVETYHFYYLLLASLIWLFGFRFFGGKFIRPKWKIPGKFIGYLVMSFILLILLGHSLCIDFHHWPPSYWRHEPLFHL